VVLAHRYAADIFALVSSVAIFSAIKAEISLSNSLQSFPSAVVVLTICVVYEHLGRIDVGVGRNGKRLGKRLFIDLHSWPWAFVCGGKNGKKMVLERSWKDCSTVYCVHNDRVDYLQRGDGIIVYTSHEQGKL